MKSIPILLSPAALSSATAEGLARHSEALRMGLNDKHGATGAETIHILGACGELAFHLFRYPGEPWRPPRNTFKCGGDVGPYQIRTRSRRDYDLLIREDDDVRARFVLVVGPMPEMVIVGWCWGRDARQPRWWKDYGGRGEPAWWVPQVALRGWSQQGQGRIEEE